MPFLDYIIVVIICIILICVYAFLTTDEDGDKPKIYSKGYIILFTLLSLIPYFNVFVGIALLVIYIMLRAAGVLKLKHNKFTEKWFGVNN